MAETSHGAGEYTVRPHPFELGDGYDWPHAVYVAIENSVGFRPEPGFLDEIAVAWDFLLDLEDADIATSRNAADIIAVYSTNTQAVIRCALDEVTPQANIIDANRLVLATTKALGRFGIVASPITLEGEPSDPPPTS